MHKGGEILKFSTTFFHYIEIADLLLQITEFLTFPCYVLITFYCIDHFYFTVFWLLSVYNKGDHCFQFESIPTAIDRYTKSNFYANPNS